MEGRGYLVRQGGLAVLSVGVLWLVWSLLPGLAARWVFAALETNWRVVGSAGRVDLNLFTLEARVEDLTLAVAGAEASPFLVLERATVELPWSALFGAPAVELIDVDAPALSLRTFADGTSNLPLFPPGDPASDAAGAPWRLGVVRLARLSMSWVDEARRLSVTVDPADLRLHPTGDEGAANAGVLTLSSATRVNWGEHETTLAPLEARLALDATRLVVEDVVIEAPEGQLVLAGEIALDTPETALGLRFDYGGNLDLTRLAAWLEGAGALTGAVQIAGRVEGSPADPTVTARIESERIGWGDLSAAGVTASARFAAGRVSLSDLQAAVAAGAIVGEGAVTLTGDEPSGEIGLSWTDLDASRLAASIWPTAPFGDGVQPQRGAGRVVDDVRPLVVGDPSRKPPSRGARRRPAARRRVAFRKR